MLDAVFVWFLSHGSRLTVWSEMINIVQNCSRQGDKVKNCLTERQNAAYITDGNTGVKRAGARALIPENYAECFT